MKYNGGQHPPFTSLLSSHLCFIALFQSTPFCLFKVAIYILSVLIYSWEHIRNSFHLLFGGAGDLTHTEPSNVSLSDTPSAHFQLSCWNKLLCGRVTLKAALSWRLILVLISEERMWSRSFAGQWGWQEQGSLLSLSLASAGLGPFPHSPGRFDSLFVAWVGATSEVVSMDREKPRESNCALFCLLTLKRFWDLVICHITNLVVPQTWAQMPCGGLRQQCKPLSFYKLDREI